MSAPPATVEGGSGCVRTRAPSSVVKNGSMVDTIAVRTGPSTARPRRKNRNATAVPMIANPAMLAQAAG